MPGAEGPQGEDIGASSQGHGKSGQSKQKTKKRHGYVSLLVNSFSVNA